MMLNKDNNSSDDIGKLFSTYTKHWIWFILSCLICGIGAFFYLRYTTPEYSSSAKIMLLNDETSTSPASAILKDLKQISESETTRVGDEIEILKSRRLMENVVKKLKLNIQYYTEGRFHYTQLFPNPPIIANFIESDSIIDKSRLHISLEITSTNDFNYKFKDEDPYKKSSFGKKITTAIGGLVVLPSTENIPGLIGKKMFIDVKPTYSVADKYKSKIRISQAGEFSKIINLSLQDPVALKSRMVIDTLIAEYNRVSIEAKNQKSKRAADFINERIGLIYKDLSSADHKIEQFKTRGKLTDITSEASLFLNSNAETEKELASKRTELSTANFLRNQIDTDESSFTRIPGNIGDGAISNMVSKYNELLDNRNALLKSSNEKNPTIVSLDEQLNNLKGNLKQSLDNTSRTISIQIRSLENRYNKLSSKIFAIPGQARESRDIERERDTKESLYLYLLEKREEATISLTSTSPNAKIIDSSYSSNSGPVSPKKNFTYLAAIMLGLCIPFSVIYLKNLLDTKIHNKEDFDESIKNNITILGEVPKIKGTSPLVQRNDRSILSESFRIIRTNFDYIRRARKVEKYDNVIFVTSSINGEGKSFFSINLALTLANTDKRVLLIGADIRNPKLLEGLKSKGKKAEVKIGLTEYLVDNSVIIGEAINTYEVNGNKIDVLLSGKIPPNPAELLMSDRMEPLFDKVSEQYDYVIVDTAPSMLVTDTLLFSQYAGHTIYMIRADYTEKRILNFAKELHAENKLNGMMLVVNDVKQSSFGYGAKYGYYGAKEKKGFFRKRA